MNLDQVLAAIRDGYPDADILHLVDLMAFGNISVRKQLADMVCREPARLRPSILFEVSRWGLNDDLSQCAEIRSAA